MRIKENIRNLIALFIFLFIQSHILFGKKPVVQSRFKTDSIKVDGVLNDWPDYWTQDKTGFSYLIMNDKENLYVGFRVIEPNVLSKIRRFGFTLWLDTEGKGKKRFGINYPLKKNMDRNRPNGQGSQRPERQLSDPSDFERTPDLMMILIGFNQGKKKTLTTTDSEPGMEISYIQDPFDGFHYELVLPFQKIGINAEDFSKDPEKFLSLAFETGYLHLDIQSGGPQGRSGGRSMGGRGGGRPGGGGRSGTRNPQERTDMMQEMTHSTRLLLKQVHLASK